MAERTGAKKPAVTSEKVGVQRVAGPGPLKGIGGYFKGAWVELKAVRWPNRQSTWSLTLAVLGFTAFFIVLILLVDAAFNFLFRNVILK